MNVFPDMSKPSRNPNFIQLIYSARFNGAKKEFYLLQKNFTPEQIRFEFAATHGQVSREPAVVRKYWVLKHQSQPIPSKRMKNEYIEPYHECRALQFFSQK